MRRDLALAEVKESCKRQWFADANLHATMLAGAAESRDLALIEEIRDRKIPRQKADLATLVDKVLSPRASIPRTLTTSTSPRPKTEPQTFSENSDAIQSLTPGAVTKSTFVTAPRNWGGSQVALLLG